MIPCHIRKLTKAISANECGTINNKVEFRLSLFLVAFIYP